jgi:hypothetical protein
MLSLQAGGASPMCKRVKREAVAALRGQKTKRSSRLVQGKGMRSVHAHELLYALENWFDGWCSVVRKIMGPTRLRRKVGVKGVRCHRGLRG